MRDILSVYDTPTAEEFAGLLSGAVQVHDPFGRPMPHRLTTEEQREALEMAKRHHYLVVQAGKTTNL